MVIDIRRWLKTLRTKRMLTHAQTAKMAGISRPFYTEIENGLKNPSVVTAKRLAKILEFDWIRFFDEN